MYSSSSSSARPHQQVTTLDLHCCSHPGHWDQQHRAFSSTWLHVDLVCASEFPCFHSFSERGVFVLLAARAPEDAYNCSICYDEATRTKFWGFVSCIVKLQDLAEGKDTRLKSLSEMVRNVLCLCYVACHM